MQIEELLAALGLLLTGAGLAFAGLQLIDTRRSERGQLLLQLDEKFYRHVVIHQRLRPGGDWAEAGKGPNSAEEWSAVEAYMALFERMNYLRRERMVELRAVDSFYGYRLCNLVRNSLVLHEKIEERGRHWRDFIELWEALSRLRGGFVARNCPCPPNIAAHLDSPSSR
jgi:hypothetical protein